MILGSKVTGMPAGQCSPDDAMAFLTKSSLGEKGFILVYRSRKGQVFPHWKQREQKKKKMSSDYKTQKSISSDILLLARLYLLKVP